MAAGTTAIDLALTTEGDADGSELITLGEGELRVEATGALQYIPNHEAIAIGKLAPPFWGKPRIATGLQAFVREIQALEDVVWELLDSRTLENADLPRLKVLGKIVGQPRLHFEVEAYRRLIEARALANVSRGRASDLLGVLTLLLGAGQYILLELGNATLFLSVLGSVSTEEIDMVEQILPDTRAAGVGLQFLFYWEDNDDPFFWGDAWGDPQKWGSVKVL